jgi:3-oxoacyl-[acyl-carrier protein] reductase
LLKGMEQQVILISGGSRGLGAAIARRCLDSGHIVATFSRSSSPFIEKQQEQDPQRARFDWTAIDGRDDEALKRCVHRVVDQYGAIDVLVNNAAIGRFGSFPLARLSDITESLDINIRTNLLLARLCTPHMASRLSGCILNISSVNAVRGNAGVAIYSATKAALDGLTRALARELGPSNIRVNSLAPGYFESDMVGGLTNRQIDKLVRSTPLRRLGTIEEIAGAALFLISPAAAFITGHTLVVDGGVTC